MKRNLHRAVSFGQKGKAALSLQGDLYVFSLGALLPQHEATSSFVLVLRELRVIGGTGAFSGDELRFARLP